MTMQLKPESVNYLRPDIEYKQLVEDNVVACLPGANTSVPAISSNGLKTRTTGNGIIYLDRWFNVDAEIAANEVIATLPVGKTALQDTIILGTVLDTGVYTVVPFLVTGNTIEALSIVAATATYIRFDNAYYLTRRR